MELTQYLGWSDSSALEVLDKLHILPNVDPYTSEPLDIGNFLSTTEGRNYIADEINRFNQKHKTIMEFREVSGIYSLVLVWVLTTPIGDPRDDIVHHSAFELRQISRVQDQFEKASRNFEKITDPQFHSIINLEDWYNMIQDDDSSDDNL